MTPLDLTLKGRLQTVRLGHSHRHFDALASTQEEAAQWAEDGGPTGALVTTDHQRKGRGRLGRTWQDEPGQDLALSLLLRPKLRPEHLGLLPLAAALAVADTLGSRTDGVTLKWPNDVLRDGLKIAGVLAETRWRTCGSGSQSPTVLLGIGINVNRENFPPDLLARATSLRASTGVSHERPEVLADLLLALEARFLLSPEALIQAVEARMPSLGARVEIGFPGTPRMPLAGKALGLDASGALRLETESGTICLHSGETTVLS